MSLSVNLPFISFLLYVLSIGQMAGTCSAIDRLSKIVLVGQTKSRSFPSKVGGYCKEILKENKNLIRGCKEGGFE